MGEAGQDARVLYIGEHKHLIFSLVARRGLRTIDGPLFLVQRQACHLRGFA